MNNSLAEVHPELVSEWSEKNLTLTPDDITFGSNKKVWWRGACGHVWQTRGVENKYCYDRLGNESVRYIAIMRWL